MPLRNVPLSAVYAYNGDNELTSQTSSLFGTTSNTYDPNGSLTSSSTGGVVTATYTYDARNKMIGYTAGTTTASYVYDDAGNRVQETVNGVTTFYLTDTQNPTGYAQPIEQKSSPTATPTMTYFLGDRIFGQVDGSGTVTYLMPDGHGSAEQLANSSGTVTAVFQYDAFGTALNFTPASAGTVFLFGGDAVYDPASGTYFHGDGVRQTDGFLFLEQDTSAGLAEDPLSLHKYLYANGNPVISNDPSGHAALLGTLGAVSYGADMYAQDAQTGMVALAGVGTLLAAIAGYEAGELMVESNLGNFSSAAAGVALAATVSVPLALFSQGGGLRVQSGRRLKDLGIDAEGLKEAFVGAMGSRYNVAVGPDGEVVLVPVNPGSGPNIDTGLNIDDAPDEFPPED